MSYIFNRLMAGDGEGFTHLFYILICNFALYCNFQSAVFMSKMIFFKNSILMCNIEKWER